MQYLTEIVRREAGEGRPIESLVVREYVRAMRFLYQMERAARERADTADAIAALYRGRGLSTDTAIEAGYLVHLGLATMKAVEPARRIRRVLIVGPGLDLAPRTGLLEAGAPESYQPYAVMDALIAAGLARLEDVTVTGADVNPHVVYHLQSATSRDVVLTLVTGVGDSDTVTLEDDYRRYVDGVGAAIGTPAPAPALPDRYRGHLRKSVRLRRDASQRVDAVTLDVATQRLGGAPFDLVVATNVFPYFDDASLALALANIAAMLAPGGILLHNEPRPLVADVTRELGVPLAHARTAVIATVRGSAAPLYDSVFVHVKTTVPGSRSEFAANTEH